MTVYRISGHTIRPVDTTSFEREQIRERQDLQRLFEENLDVIAPGCFLLTDEFDEWATSRRRIDLLALDTSANPIVIELKRTEDDKFVELQALTYAAMASSMTFEQAVQIHAKYLSKRKKEGDAQTRILSFLGWAEPRAELFAQDVRIVVVAPDFAPDVTSTVLWLRDHDIDMQCVRISPLSLDGSILFDVHVLIPLPEAEAYQQSIRIKQREEREGRQFSGRRGSFFLDTGKQRLEGLTAARLALEAIRWAIVDRGVQPVDVGNSVRFNRGNLFLELPTGSSETDVEAALRRLASESGKRAAFEPQRWFHGNSELIPAPDRTLVVSTQWEVQAAQDAAAALIARFGTGRECIGATRKDD